MYALVDCNNFYASCERVFNPSLNGRPIIVLSNNDGCAIARSQEAKDLGIKMGDPAFLIQDKIDKHNIAVFSSNYTLYGDMSQRVMNLLGEFTPEVEVYSIDEAFLNLDGYELFDLYEYGKNIRQRIRRCTGIPVCVGIAPTKTLAKLANRLAKKKTEIGVYTIDSEEKRIEALKLTEIGDIWGVGGQYSKFLSEYNIKTALDFVNTPDKWIQKYMSIVGLRTKKELQGIRCITMELTPPNKQNIATTRSFGNMLTEYEPIAEAVANHAAACAAKLRKQHSSANHITVFVHTNQFRADLPQYARNRVLHLPVASNSSTELIKYALHGLKSIYKQGFSYKKAGVIVSGLVPDTEINMSLFDTVDRTRQKKAMEAIDLLNNRFGREKVKVASQGFGRKWKLKQEKLSPCYTTNWNEILTIKV
ncbi:MAG: Y-family DNA polymerase [Pedobacter sp.]|nr:MAG: Y-family DNA polymerase [Pedobacter sp.]